MSLKSWVLDRVHRMNAVVSRADLPARGSAQEPALEAPREVAPRGAWPPRAPAADAALSSAEHLGAYALLIDAIRDELEHFVASHVRLHLAIADHDRFLLTSIGVRCPDAADARALLQQFMHEFKPEQVKRYLAREVIGALPNAAAIDLSQFAGLFDADARDDADAGGEYRELLAALRSTPMSSTARPYQVNLLGRWTELDPARSAAAAHVYRGATPSTPLAGQRCEFDLEDGDGRRRVVLQAVVPGRRYVVGKGEGCDIRVNGTYTSSRHAEIWLDNGAWWVADAGSTNGMRVEPPGGAPVRNGPATAAGNLDQPLRLIEGARIVLSARAEGPASDYPWVALRPHGQAAAPVTPIAHAATSPKTPLTAILPARPDEPVYEITAFQAGGAQALPLRVSSLPLTVGRSRNQTLVIDRRHEGVSGHHLDIIGLDESGAQLAIHGDNGVLIDGVPHASGARVRWQAGQTMVLGASLHEDPVCRLLLKRLGD
jgi:pSer/pThr/pTyr-binding forkhead associated (FHA) protein